MADKPFLFICGADDFLVDRLGKERFEELARDVPDEFSREIINGFVNNVSELATSLNRFRDSVQTIAMFGGRRLVWFKDINFLADSVTGRAEGTRQLVEDLQAILATVNPAETAVLLTAAPVDRRRAFPKWCEKNAGFTLVGGGNDDRTLAHVVAGEARELQVTITPEATHLLLKRVGANTRLLLGEVRKLATYVAPPEGGPARIEEAHVAELTPNVSQGDFFETAEAFFSGDLRWTLASLHRHFFVGGDARPVLAALQNRNRILIQVCALLDAGEARLNSQGLNGLAEAAPTYASKFGGATEKSAFNVFTQNAWYVGKLAGSGKLPALHRLIDNQKAFVRAFETIIDRPNEQEAVLRDMAISCLP